MVTPRITQKSKIWVSQMPKLVTINYFNSLLHRAGDVPSDMFVLTVQQMGRNLRRIKQNRSRNLSTPPFKQKKVISMPISPRTFLGSLARPTSLL